MNQIGAQLMLMHLTLGVGSVRVCVHVRWKVMMNLKMHIMVNTKDVVEMTDLIYRMSVTSMAPHMATQKGSVVKPLVLTCTNVFMNDLGVSNLMEIMILTVGIFIKLSVVKYLDICNVLHI
jgi:hypothetical protein